jgi:phage gp36-like protein
MAYTDKTEMEKRFGTLEIAQLIDSQPDGSEDPGRLDAAISDADGLIDSYLAVQFTVPIPDPIPDALVGASSDLARFRLWDDGAPESVRQRYEDAVTWLQKIADGEIGLPGQGEVIPQDGIGTPVYQASPRIFTRETLSRYLKP